MCIILFKWHPTLLWKLPELFDLLPLRLPTTESPPRTKQQMKKKCCCFRQALLARAVPAATCKKNTCFEGNYSGLCLPIFIQGTCFRINFLPLASTTWKQHQPKPPRMNFNPEKEAFLPLSAILSARIKHCDKCHKAYTLQQRVSQPLWWSLGPLWPHSLTSVPSPSHLQDAPGCIGTLLQQDLGSALLMCCFNGHQQERGWSSALHVRMTPCTAMQKHRLNKISHFA